MTGEGRSEQEAVVVEEQLVAAIEADLRELVERELRQFLEHYEECQRADDIWITEDLWIGMENVRLHGWVCTYRSNIFVRRDDVFEIPQFLCWIDFSDPEHYFARRLANINIVYLPNLNRCYVKAEIHEHEIRDVAEHIAITAGKLLLLEETAAKQG
jgi:hypothetical protein